MPKQETRGDKIYSKDQLGLVVFMSPVDPGQPRGDSTNEREALRCILMSFPVLVVCFRQVYSRSKRVNDAWKTQSMIRIPYLDIHGIRLIQTCLFAIICCCFLVILKAYRSCSVFIERNPVVTSIVSLPAKLVGATVVYRVLSVPYLWEEVRLESGRVSCLFRFLDITALHHADLVIAATNDACNRLSWRSNVRKIPFSVAPQFYSVCRKPCLELRTEGTRQGALSIGYLGSFNTLYDFREFLDAVRSLIAYATLNVKLVGDGPCKPEVLELVSLLDLRGVEIQEAIGPEKVSAFLETLDVLVNPQIEKHRGLSIKVLEAMAAGSVVITTVGHPEYGKTEDSYLLVKNRADEFRLAISRLLSDQTLLREVSERARKHALQFSRHSVARHWGMALLSLVRKTCSSYGCTEAYVP